MSKVIISADSTCDLSKEIIDRYSLNICHCPVTLGNESRIDGIDVFPTDLFEYYDRTGDLAKTSAVNYQGYTDHFKKLLKQGDAVVHFCISAEMSSMYNNAKLAAEDIGNVFVIDSRNLSTGSALLVIKAAELAASGVEAQDIYDKICALTDNVDASFIIDTLTYLYKGGRCSALAMLGANMLKLKPCIEVKNGKMDVGKKYRGKLGDVLLEYAKARLSDINNIDKSRCFVTHTMGSDDERVKAVYDYVSGLGYFDEVLETSAGCTVSAHCGPGTLGVLFIKK